MPAPLVTEYPLNPATISGAAGANVLTPAGCKDGSESSPSRRHDFVHFNGGDDILQLEQFLLRDVFILSRFAPAPIVWQITRQKVSPGLHYYLSARAIRKYAMVAPVSVHTGVHRHRLVPRLYRSCQSLMWAQSDEGDPISHSRTSSAAGCR